MVASSFDQVLYLDPDSLPLRDPSGLFSSPLYKQHGAVFWPSINRDHPDNPIWRFIGQPCSNEFWQLDAGQMLVDKRGNDGLNLAALQLAAYMQKPQSHASTTDPDEGFGGASFFSQLSDEGRDEIRYGFMTLNISYNPAPRWLSAAGTRVVESEGGSGLTASNDEAGKFCGHSLLQYDVEPRAGASSRPRPSDYSPLFLHNNLTDQVRGLAPGRFWTHLKHFADNDVDSVGLESARAHVVRLGDGARAFHCLEVEMQHGGSGNGLIVTDKTKNVWQGKFAEWENAYWDSRRKAERAAPDYTRLRRVRRRLEEMDAGADAFFVA